MLYCYGFCILNNRHNNLRYNNENKFKKKSIYFI